VKYYSTIGNRDGKWGPDSLQGIPLIGDGDRDRDRANLVPTGIAIWEK